MLNDEKSDILVDKDGALIRVGGDENIYNELMELFLQSSSEQIDELKEAVRKRESDEIKRLAHSIKGAAANLGILHVQKTAYDLELIGAENRIQEASKSLNSLIKELERFKNFWSN
mgnify:FL=1